MQTDFEQIVDLVVTQWPKREKKLFEGGGLIGIPSRKMGDIAEDYIVTRISAITPNYTIIKSKGSRTPADIYALAKHKDYWHIILIQVKSSLQKDKIVSLNESDIKLFNELGETVRDVFKESVFSNKHGNKSILISNGYAGVWRIKTDAGHRHRLEKTRIFTLFRHNLTLQAAKNATRTIQRIHDLYR